MAVPKPHDGLTADKDREWSWSEEGAGQVEAMLEQGGWKKVAEAHAWYDDADGDPPEKKTAYKLPHHELVDGKLQVVWRGLANAMSVLAGGRGGVDIPEKEKRDVWRHLARHYEQFGEESRRAVTGVRCQGGRELLADE